jgi:hypothetical protein
MVRMLSLVLPLLGSTASAAVAPHASFHQVVSSNGHTAIIYDDALAKVTGLREHCYAAVDATTPTRELAYDAYFGLRLGGTGKWLSELGAPPAVRYLPGPGSSSRRRPWAAWRRRPTPSRPSRRTRRSR